MAAKFILVCVASVMVQMSVGQIVGGLGAPWSVAGANWGGLGAGCGCGGVASTGGGFPVTSVSPIAPTGVSVRSENAYEGSLAAGGSLPLLGTVALEGVLPTAGAGAVSYGCGDGAVGIVREDGPVLTGIASSPLYSGLGYGQYGPGCGCALY